MGRSLTGAAHFIYIKLTHLSPVYSFCKGRDGAHYILIYFFGNESLSIL